MSGEPPVRRRLIGTALRRYRQNLGYALDDAARILECDRSKISRIETGQRGIRPKELRELLAEYGVPEAERAALLTLARRGEGHWQGAYPDVLPATFTEYLAMEKIAAEIMIYEAQIVPALLQTKAYARALAAADPLLHSDQEREQVLALLRARQDTVLDAGTRLVVLIGEAALRQQVGDTQVMRGQLRHLAGLAEESAHVSLQVVPFAAGAHVAAVGSASLAIVRFPDAPSLGVVYLEALSGGVYRESTLDIARYVRAFTLLRSAALSGAGTSRLLAGLLRRPES